MGPDWDAGPYFQSERRGLHSAVIERHGHMKELRVRGTIRVLFAFDPSRSAVLLLAGDKRRKADRWHGQAIPRADRIYDEYLEWLIAGGDLDGPQSAYLRWPT